MTSSGTYSNSHNDRPLGAWLTSVQELLRHKWRGTVAESDSNPVLGRCEREDFTTVQLKWHLRVRDQKRHVNYGLCELFHYGRFPFDDSTLLIPGSVFQTELFHYRRCPFDDSTLLISDSVFQTASRETPYSTCFDIFAIITRTSSAFSHMSLATQGRNASSNNTFQFWSQFLFRVIEKQERNEGFFSERTVILQGSIQEFLIPCRKISSRLKGQPPWFTLDQPTLVITATAFSVNTITWVCRGCVRGNIHDIYTKCTYTSRKTSKWPWKVHKTRKI